MRLPWPALKVVAVKPLLVLNLERVHFTVHQFNFSFVKGRMCHFFFVSHSIKILVHTVNDVALSGI